MADKETKHMLRCCILPVILGSGAASHKLSFLIKRRLGCISLICDARTDVFCLFDPSCMFYKLAPHTSGYFLAKQLIDLTKRYDEYMLLLIPMSDKYRDLTDSYSDILETNFVISSPSSLFKSTTLASFMSPLKT